MKVEDVEPARRPLRQDRKNRAVLGLFMTVNAVILFVVLYAKFVLHVWSDFNPGLEETSQPQIFTDDRYGAYITCPEDSVSARQSNCSFDLLANGWIPNPCFDAAMHHDFVDGKDYGFFEDIEGTNRVHQNTIMEGDLSLYPDGLFVTFDEHFQHCLYLLNGSVRAIEPPFTGFLDIYHDMGHLQHCLGVLSETRDALHIETTVKAFFVTHKCYLSVPPALDAVS